MRRDPQKCMGLTRSALLAAPANNTPMEGPGELVADWSGEACAVEVALSQFLTAYDVLPPRQSPIYCGIQGSGIGAENEPRDAGYFKIEYGIGSHTRVRYVDLMAARLFLGYCDNVRVTARRWRGATYAGSYSNAIANVAGAVGLASGGAYDELTSTQVGFTASGATMSVEFFPPEGAYALEWSVGNFSVTSFTPYWGTVEPAAVLMSQQETARIVPANDAIAPPFRRLNIQGPASVRTSTNVIVANGLLTTGRWLLNS